MSSGVTLSSATRSNLLSLQDTADLVATTQQRLSTGKKVNSAIDNASNFFTASSLSSRSSALSTLLDGISNGIQTIQAASTGITGIQKLTAQLKSTAQQALASSNSFSSKATSTFTNANAAASNLLSSGVTDATAATAVGTPAGTVGTAVNAGVAYAADSDVTSAFGAAKTFTIDGVSINTGGAITTKQGLLDTINAQLKAGGSGVVATFDGGTNKLTLTGTSDGATFGVSGTNSALITSSATPTTNGTTAKFVATGSTNARTLGFTDGQTFKVNGATVTVSKTDTLDILSQKITAATGGAVTGSFTASSGTFELKAADAATGVTIADGSATGAAAHLGFTGASTFAAGTGTTGNYNSLSGTALTVTVAGGKTKTINFGTNTAIGQVSTLDQLNAALTDANAQASIDSTGKITVTTTNEAGAEDLTVASGGQFTSGTTSAVIGGDGNTTRNKLVTDYNNLLTQIDQLSADSGFNGVNLLAGDQVKVIFNEKNTSSVSIKGVSTDSSTLGLAALGSTDFQDGTTINKVLDSISAANNTLESQAATFGTNLSVVQNRQDFSKGLINILDTGAANLTDADLNEEAANSQALTTRQSLGVSALSLANQAQQGHPAAPALNRAHTD